MSRYPVSPLVNPRENRLTEAFAAVLERVDGLAYELASDWLPTAASAAPTVSVRTQRPTVQSNFVDLELRFGGGESEVEPGGGTLVWVEVKHGANLHENQLENYLADIQFEPPAHRAVVLLAPRQAMPEAVPDGVPRVEWQQVAEALRQRLRSSNDQDPVDRWLIVQFLDYLKEEALMDDEMLTSGHAFALAAQPSAERAIAKLCEFADSYVEQNWGPHTNRAKRYGTGYWTNWDTHRPGESAPETWRSAIFEWALVEDGGRTEARDAWAFVAGATFLKAKDNPAVVSGNEAWIAARRTQGFEYLQSWYWRLWRHRYPEELLVATTLEAQGRRLGEWIVESFELLAASPPEH